MINREMVSHLPKNNLNRLWSFTPSNVVNGYMVGCNLSSVEPLQCEYFFGNISLALWDALRKQSAIYFVLILCHFHYHDTYTVVVHM